VSRVDNIILILLFLDNSIYSFRTRNVLRLFWTVAGSNKKRIWWVLFERNFTWRAWLEIFFKLLRYWIDKLDLDSFTELSYFALMRTYTFLREALMLRRSMFKLEFFFFINIARKLELWASLLLIIDGTLFNWVLITFSVNTWTFAAVILIFSFWTGKVTLLLVLRGGFFAIKIKIR